MQSVLITGGAGFIGSRLARSLLDEGCAVRILDNLTPQVHGAKPALQDWMKAECDVRIADICDPDAVRSALKGIDWVVHLAAETGPAQSMYEITRYVQANCLGTAVLLEAMLPHRERIRRLIVASSRSIYGEGKYHCGQCGDVFPHPRSEKRLQARQWEPVCPICGMEIMATGTDEEALPKPTSIYAVSKLNQEQMCLTWGRVYGVPTRALRYQNVYGPGQSLTNPYIGVLAIFAARIKSGSVLHVYEDGKESRDFVHVDDSVEATRLALRNPDEGCEAYNVGSGQATSLAAIANLLAAAMERPVPIEVTGKYRAGDIRHCYADLKRISSTWGYQPAVSLQSGLRELAEWTWEQEAFSDELEQATRELVQVGLYPLNNSVGIVLVNYNGQKFMPDCLRSLQQIDYPNYRVIVVDNASTDGSPDWVAENHPDIALLRHSENLGITGGNNAGIRWCLEHECDWVLLLNNDTVVEPDFLSQLIKESEPNCLIAPKIYFFDKKNLINNHLGGYDYWRGVHKDWFYGKQDSDMSRKSRMATMANTCALLIPSATFSDTGFMNDAYFIYSDDADFIANAIQMGRRIKFVPSAVLYHKESSSSGGRESPLLVYYTNRNRLYFMMKHQPNRFALLFFFVYFSLTRIARIAQYAMRGQWTQIRALKNGIVDFCLGRMGKASPVRFR